MARVPRSSYHQIDTHGPLTAKTINHEIPAPTRFDCLSLCVHLVRPNVYWILGQLMICNDQGLTSRSMRMHGMMGYPSKITANKPGPTPATWKTWMIDLIRDASQNAPCRAVAVWFMPAEV